MLGSRHIKFESHGRTEVLQFELLLNRGDQIWRFVFLDRHFGVSCHPKRIRSDNFETGKKQIEIVRHNLFEPDEALEFVASLQLLCLRSLVVLTGNGNETPKHVRQLDPSEAFTSFKIFDDDREIETEVRDMGKRVSRVDGQRSQSGKYLAYEVLAEAVTVPLVQFINVEHMNARFAQLGQEILLPTNLMPLRMNRQVTAYGQHLFRRRHGIRGSLTRPSRNLAAEA